MKKETTYLVYKCVYTFSVDTHSSSDYDTECSVIYKLK